MNPDLTILRILCKFSTLKETSQETLLKRVIPKCGKHFIFLGDSDFAIAHEATYRFAPPVCSTKCDQMFIWFASSARILKEASDYFLNKDPGQRLVVLVRREQEDLDLYAKTQFRFLEDHRSGLIYGKNVIR